MYNVVSYEYFMDDMQDYEIQTLSAMLDYVDYNEWRRTRMLYYAAVAPYMKRQQTPEKLMPLPGDDEAQQHDIEMTNTERDMMRQRASYMQQFMKHDKQINDSQN